MEGVTFNDDTETAPRRTVPSKKESILVRLVLAFGLAKDAAGAQVVLFILAVLCFAGAIFVQVWLSQTYSTPKAAPGTLTQSHK